MLNYKVTCANCMTTIVLTEKSLMHSSFLVCPECNSKLPANEMKHLKSDLQYRKKHPGFHASVYDAKDINLKKITSFAFDHSLNCLLKDFETHSLSEEDATAFFSDNDYLLNYCQNYSNSLLTAYHLRLASILREQGIELGNLITDYSSPHASHDIVPNTD